jgi:predicted DNA-binding protein with PD1-like motif
MRLIATRLEEGVDLKAEIEAVVRRYQLSSATIISAVGSLNRARMRMAGAEPESQDIREFNGRFEIVSLIGNLGSDRSHLHIAIADTEGKVLGGHLKEGSIVHTTVELVIATDESVVFTSKHDQKTGFDELEIREA